MKKFVILPTLALLLTVGVFALGQQSKSAHAQAPTTAQSTNVVKQSVTASGEKPDTMEAGTKVKGSEVDVPGGQSVSEKGSEPKGTETDGPGGHQDLQGSNVGHQYNGAE